METVAERMETTHRVLREQLSSFAGRTRRASAEFAQETREATGELTQTVTGEARAWSELVSSQTTKLLEAGPTVSAPRLSPRDIDALERRLLAGLRDILCRLDARLRGRIEADARAGVPVKGYDALSAKAVLGLLPELDAAALDAVATYEAAHKARKTVLDAVERRP